MIFTAPMEKRKKVGMNMKIPKHIREKMHKMADLQRKAADLSILVDNWFIEHGFNIEELRDGSGISLEELDYGNDVTDLFCDRVENGDFCSYREEK